MVCGNKPFLSPGGFVFHSFLLNKMRGMNIDGELNTLVFFFIFLQVRGCTTPAQVLRIQNTKRGELIKRLLALLFVHDERRVSSLDR